MSDRYSKRGTRMWYPEGERDLFVPEAGVKDDQGRPLEEGAFDTGDVVRSGGDPDPTGVIASIDASLGVPW